MRTASLAACLAAALAAACSLQGAIATGGGDAGAVDDQTDATPDDPTADAGPQASALVCGYNFGDETNTDVVLDGRTLIARTPAGDSTLALHGVGGPLNAWVTSIGAADFVPAADEPQARLLNQHLSVSEGGLHIEQGVTDGTYQVFTYHMENLTSHWRSFDVVVEGAPQTASPLSLEQYHWVRLGPFEAVVTDGVLDIELVHVTKDASIMGLEIYSTTDGAVADLPAPSGPPGWTLVWSDEFDGAGQPDPGKWSHEEGYIRNNELQYYTRERLDNARVEEGNLVIECRRDWFEGHEITSASLHTAGKRHFRYGRVEVRAKLPTGLGTWPAIWMLGTNIGTVGWPNCGEIDIMENVGYDPERIYGTVHTEAYNHVDGTAVGGNLEVAAPWADYHVYAVEWFPDHIDFLVDDQSYFSFANQGTTATWPFDQEFYLILNFAFGGAWGGAQGVNKDLLPLSYYIDYVRVYEPE